MLRDFGQAKLVRTSEQTRVLHHGIITGWCVAEFGSASSYDMNRQHEEAASFPSAHSPSTFPLIVPLDRGYIGDEYIDLQPRPHDRIRKERVPGYIYCIEKAAINEEPVGEDNKFAFLLRDKLDPFHTFFWWGYLAVLPSLALVVYLIPGCPADGPGNLSGPHILVGLPYSLCLHWY
jgi:hypothetical protein